jgi:hypothetical protein
MLQMHAAEYPIPETLVQAFRATAAEFREWRKYGGPEPQVQFEGEPHSIDWIAELASHFEDPMPEDIFDFLKLIGGFRGEPVRNTFSVGGRYLCRVYTEHQQLLAQRQE